MAASFKPRIRNSDGNENPFFARQLRGRAKKDCSGRSDPSCGFGVGEGIATLINYLDCFVASLRFTPRNDNAAVLSLA